MFLNSFFLLFECDLTAAQLAKLRGRLGKLIRAEEDSVRFYFLCGCCAGKVERIGGVEVRDDSIFFA